MTLMLTRRQMLLGSALLPVVVKSDTAQPFIALTSDTFSQQVLPTRYAGPTQVSGFNNTVPGPTLRIGQNTRLSVHFENQLDTPTAIHWHGIRGPNAMDGVPGLTQSPVASQARFDYSFNVPDSGTFWYHAHHRSHEQVARGLFGALVVEDNNPPETDHDIVATLTDWLLTQEGAIDTNFERPHDISHAGRLGNFVRAFVPDVTLKRGERIRLRLVNAAVDRVFSVDVSGLQGVVVALDGMPLPQPRPLGRLVLAPAQRIDVIADIAGEVALDMVHRMGPYPLARLPLDGAQPVRDTPVAALPPNALIMPGTPERHVTLNMTGGAMAPRHKGDNIWAFNGMSGMQDTPLLRVDRDETVRLTLINNTRFPHGIHLHGHHFHEATPDGTLGDYRDTTLLLVGEKQDIVCVFNNPGRWMLHCHMLSHQFGGMKTWIDVV